MKKLTKQVSIFLGLYLFYYDFCKLKHTQVQQGFVITVYLLQNTHAGDQQAAVLQRSGTKRGALGSQAHAQGRGVAGESHRRHRLQGTAAEGAAQRGQAAPTGELRREALHGKGNDGIKAGISRGEGGDAPCARNRGGAHRRRRIEGRRRRMVEGKKR